MLSDWTVYKTGNPGIGIVTALATPDSITPITGNGSLRVQQFTPTELNTHLYNTTYDELGILKGKIRSVFRPQTFSGIEHYSAGFVFMQSQLNVTAAGNCYFAHLTVETGIGNLTVYIRKFIGTGLRGDLDGDTVLYTGSNYGDYLGENICFEVEWDSYDIDGTTITVRIALASSDFDDLVEETVIVDSSSPLVVSVAEGLAFTNGILSGSADWLVDSTNLKSLL